jgi:hypothetical protein
VGCKAGPEALFRNSIPSVSKQKASQLGYILAIEPFPIREMKRRVVLSSTNAAKRIMQKRKQIIIWEDFYAIDAYAPKMISLEFFNCGI